MAKLKVALYWAASCGGCEISVLDVGAKILDFAAGAEIVFWPAALDFKYKDVEAMPDGSIDLTLFNGAIRTAENEHVAQLLRRKSKILVAYGSCAHEGCIPGLANMTDREGIFERIYQTTPSTANPEKTRPQTSTKVPEGKLSLPEFYDTVKTLAQTVEVDYFVPGCPPTGERTWEVLEAVLTGKLPEKGSVVGAGQKTVCDECPREKQEKHIKAFFRPHLVIPEPETCLLEQGIFCAGFATRNGCGAQCIQVNMPCRGCYGPPPKVIDQGAKMVSALGSIIDAEDPEEVNRILDQIPNPAGYFYRFGLPLSILRRRVMK
ncbi:MAG: oxidoreductase [candidate division Zixibacteria bacterium SM23_81]|nr:MAG: oxidoreductase [candidate division Zixibacteria bacterium SM23_81]